MAFEHKVAVSKGNMHGGNMSRRHRPIVATIIRANKRAAKAHVLRVLRKEMFD